MTLSDLVEMVRLRVGVSSSDTRMTAYIKKLIALEYQRTAAEEGLLEKVATLSLVKDDHVVDLPNDWQRTLQILEGNVALRPITALEYASTINGYYGPRVYFPQPPERILVSPVPSASDAQGLTIIYVAQPDALVNDSDVPTALPSEYHDLLAELAIMRTYLAEEDPNMMQTAQAQASDIHGRLRAHMNMREGRGFSRIVPPPANVS